MIHLQNVGITNDARQLVLDMKIKNLSSYVPLRPEKNALLHGGTLQVNMAAGTWTGLEFSLWDSVTGDAVMVDAFELTFLDLDQSDDLVGQEAFSVAGCKDYILELGHEVNKLGVDAMGGTKFGSKMAGLACDNPPDPWDLQHVTCKGTVTDQAKRAVMFGFQDKHNFFTTFYVPVGNRGRNFIFAGRSSLVEACRNGQNGESGSCA